MTDLIRSGNRWHLACAIMLLCATVFLTNRACDEYHWSGWGFGDAQTMLSVKQWNERGWLANRLLFIPQGYAKAVELLDEPGLRHHAHGICPASSPLVGPRLWYTHYPAGYLVPFALLYKLGFTEKFHFEIFSILLSVSAVGLFYLLGCRLASRPVAFFSAFFYLVSPLFHFYADSLANQPLDDLLRFAFMLAIVMSTRDPKETRQTYWNLAAWLVQFCLSLSSLDSVFFIYVWLVGWDLIEGKGVRWKRWLAFALAPLLAHCLQFLQNVWYLGEDNALKDVLGTFAVKSVATSGMFPRLSQTVYALAEAMDALFGARTLFVLALLMLALHSLLFRRESEHGFPPLRIVCLLAAAGLSFIVALPAAARMSYEPRQLLPFAAVVMAVLVWGAVLTVIRLFRGGSPADARFGKTAALSFILGTSILIVTSATNIDFFPPEELQRMDVETRKDIHLARELAKNLPAGKDAIIFSSSGFGMFIDDSYVHDYPQIHPLLEYSAGSRPILCFDKPEALVQDFRELVAKGGDSFIPVIGALNGKMLQQILVSLDKGGVIDIAKVRPIPMSERAFADLSEAVQHVPSRGKQ